MKVSASRFLILAFVLFLSTTGLAAEDGWLIRQITNSGYIGPEFYSELSENAAMGVSGKNIVWIEQGKRVMFWDGGTVSEIASSSGYILSVQISGNNVVWQEDLNNKPQIMFWDGSTARQISDGTNRHYDPRISGTNVVWWKYYDHKSYVMFWDGSTAQQISDGTDYCSSPKISGGNVVWLVRKGLSEREWQDVMCWNGEEVKQLTFNLKRKTNLSISGNNIVWTEEPWYKDISLIYYWDGDSATKLVDMPDSIVPYISGPHIAFKAMDENYDYQVFSAYRHGKSHETPKAKP